MCGINLSINYPENGEVAIQKMMASTLHRGPDHSGWMKAGHGVYIAGNRLKTHDLRNIANQPFCTEDKQNLLIWNGALYNYQDLRNRLLDLGVSFFSQSDSEVLVHWLRIYGAEGIGSLRGMYSLAYISIAKKEIILARDPSGQKPLFYHQTGNQWLFSSEARGILASGLLEKVLDKSQYIPYFYSRHSFPDCSFFKGIRQFEAGKAMVLDFDGAIQHSLSFSIEKIPGSMPTAKKLRDKLLDAVLGHFHADVPVGILLSGGMDSSLLWHIWFKETGIPLHTYTAVFEEKYRHLYQDGKYAAGLSKKYRGIHHEILVTPESVLENWPEYIQSMDQPIGDSAGLLSWMIAKEAKKSIKILIGGAGADELWSGYNRHQAYRFYLQNPVMISWIKKASWLSPFLPGNLRKFLEALSDSDRETFLNFSSLQPIPQALKEKFLAYYPAENTPYRQALEWDRKYYLINDVLKIHDNTAMAHGLEGRSPYLDREMAGWALGLTEQQLLSLKPKQYLKEILTREGLGHIAKRKKLGFGIPIKEWLTDHKAFRDKVFCTVREFENTDGPDFPQEMRKLAQQPEAFVNSSFLQIWNLFILASWKSSQNL